VAINDKQEFKMLQEDQSTEAVRSANEVIEQEWEELIIMILQTKLARSG